MHAMEQREPYRILLAPFPMTVIAAYGYYLLRKVGLVNAETQIVYHRYPKERTARRILDDKIAFRLFGKSLHARLLELINNFTPAEPFQYLRFLSFSRQPPGEVALAVHNQLQEYLYSEHYNLREILSESAQLFERWVNSGRNPFQEALRGGLCSSSQHKILQSKVPESTRFNHLPLFKTPSLHGRKIEGKRRIGISESQVAKLAGRHISVIIGGPPRSGKSSSLASLAVRMKDIVDSLRTRPGWESFELSVNHLDLDLGSPTVGQVFEMKNLKQVASQKMPGGPWSLDMAFRALKLFSEAIEKTNVLLVDLPGKIDLFTEIVGCPADAGILLYRVGERNRVYDWQRYLRRLGIARVAEARTRAGTIGQSSVVTSYDAGKRVFGWIDGLELVVRPWDAFIGFLAESLLFDILPSLLARRERKIQRAIDHLYHST